VAFSYEKLINWSFQDVVQRYTWKDSIIYALGLGFGSKPTDPAELRFVYEDGLETFPTMPVVLGHPGPWMADPETGIDMVKVLHGEQHLEIHRPLPAEGSIIGRNRVVEVVDKGAHKGALISIERKLLDESTGDLYCTQTAVIFARANGGFGGTRCMQIPGSRQKRDFRRLSCMVLPASAWRRGPCSRLLPAKIQRGWKASACGFPRRSIRAKPSVRICGAMAARCHSGHGLQRVMQSCSTMVGPSWQAVARRPASGVSSDLTVQVVSDQVKRDGLFPR